ncbi:MAG: hypothetical protein KA248_01920 [Kiritimatiellae bacterium]|nr:hypothetical protein [Kiritimatiellia bacterium]
MREKEKAERIEQALLAARGPRPAHEPAPGWQDGVMREVRRLASPDGREAWPVLLEAPMRWTVPACAAALVLLLGLNLYWNRTSEWDRIERVLSDPTAPAFNREQWIRSLL